MSQLRKLEITKCDNETGTIKDYFTFNLLGHLIKEKEFKSSITKKKQGDVSLFQLEVYELKEDLNKMLSDMDYDCCSYTEYKDEVNFIQRLIEVLEIAEDMELSDIVFYDDDYDNSIIKENVA